LKAPLASPILCSRSPDRAPGLTTSTSSNRSRRPPTCCRQRMRQPVGGTSAATQSKATRTKILGRARLVLAFISHVSMFSGGTELCCGGMVFLFLFAGVEVWFLSPCYAVHNSCVSSFLSKWIHADGFKLCRSCCILFCVLYLSVSYSPSCLAVNEGTCRLDQNLE
jgi:hypothetical protein